MSAIPVSQCAPAESWQTQFLAVLPAVRTHARIRFRTLPSEQREEATQEAIASACVAFQGLARRGKLNAATPSTLATFAVKHVNNGRHVGGSQDKAKDVLSPMSRSRHDVKVVSYHGCSTGSEDWQQVSGSHRRVPIPDLAAFRLDFAHWLQMLTSRDRRIIAALVSGEGTGAVAGRFGLSAARVSQLRRSYEHAWQVFQGEGPVTAQAS